MRHVQEINPDFPRVQALSIRSGAASLPVSYLSDESPKDKLWDTHKAQARRVAEVLACDGCGEGSVLQKQAARMVDCANWLDFRRRTDRETGKTSFKLKTAKFCHVRICPICQWRRSLRWVARLSSSLPVIIYEFPDAQFLLLTLTNRNCAAHELRREVRRMNEAFQRLSQRAEFAPVIGWIRTVEVTRGRLGDAHPHFHCLLMVRGSYFSSSDYIKQARWRELWQEAARLDYLPVVNVKKIRAGEVGRLPGGVVEVLKYAVKPSDLAVEPDSEAGEWVREVTRQLHKTRAISTGGVLKDVLKDGETDNELIHVGEDEVLGETEIEEVVSYRWDNHAGRYCRSLDAMSRDAFLSAIAPRNPRRAAEYFREAEINRRRYG